ncbi:hypothetical protein [Motiliproteus sp. SC1-56]|uniref:hypothetical protein n=1 Tax=Motiliproteus sp. SC1-56 TaxID=2799565 RepID=UPI001A8D1579|nr:hypothetical protein [Motiliproteus sp. SC1-56]
MCLEIIEKKRNETLFFSESGLAFCMGVRNSILQNDKATLLEEKVASIGMAAIFTWALGGLFAFSGAGFVLFIIGLVASRIINRKVYGRERDVKDISEIEERLLAVIAEKEMMLNALRLKIKLKNTYKEVLFVDFHKIYSEVGEFLELVKSHDSSNLSLKYRSVYESNVRKSGEVLMALNKAYCI